MRTPIFPGTADWKTGVFKETQGRVPHIHWLIVLLQGNTHLHHKSTGIFEPLHNMQRPARSSEEFNIAPQIPSNYQHPGAPNSTTPKSTSAVPYNGLMNNIQIHRRCVVVLDLYVLMLYFCLSGTFIPQVGQAHMGKLWAPPQDFQEAPRTNVVLEAYWLGCRSRTGGQQKTRSSAR